MSEKKFSYPYRALGLRLRNLRENQKESLAEVSGAVEIDVTSLESYETGEKRPTEEVLMLLISHFDAREDEAVRLWELAGYTQLRNDGVLPNEDMSGMKPIAMVVPIDNRVIYTDGVNVTVNNYGVVLNFMQSAGTNSKPLEVARVGMSKEHAKVLINILQETLQQNEKLNAPKQINPPKENDT